MITRSPVRRSDAQNREALGVRFDADGDHDSLDTTRSGVQTTVVTIMAAVRENGQPRTVLHVRVDVLDGGWPGTRPAGGCC